ncbi:hypothetical protein BN1110_05558 [bacterium YEK0313]|nr:hypothetical protein BN1110_05558 [bacterium YEK0313]
MKLQGSAFLALWNGVAPGRLDAYEAWHGIEHVPERLTVPGILAAWRYQAGEGDGARFFTLYDLAGVGVLDSAEYRRLVDTPSPMSRLMRPHLTHFSRIVCRLDRREPSPAGAFLAPIVLRNQPAAVASPEGCAVQWGRVAADAPGHPLAPPVPSGGGVLLVDGADEAMLQRLVAGLADEEDAAVFRLIGSFRA